MNGDYVALHGDALMADELKLPAARATAQAAAATDSFATLIECRVTENTETIILDVDVERPQIPVHDIKSVERIAGVFSVTDDSAPEALALRNDFPVVPHLNLRDVDKPRSLCLYDRPWTDIQSSWTGASFIERIRWWLALTARGELHEADQPLEPMMFSHGLDLVVPANFGMPDGATTMAVRVVLVDGKDGRVLVSDEHDGPDRGGKTSFVIYIETPPRSHGVIHRAPGTLANLAELIDGDGFQLIPYLRDALREMPEKIRKDIKLRRDIIPIFVLGLPKTRVEGGRVESTELKGFLCHNSIESVGSDIGAWLVYGDDIGQPLGNTPDADGSETTVSVVNVIRELSTTRAALHSGRENHDRRRFVAIGVGALGSQVAMNLARNGFGRWTVIDNDTFMPHNAVRHALAGSYLVGHNKAMCMAAYMNSITPLESSTQGIPGDFLKPGDYGKAIDDSLASADHVLDMSASVAVARSLADRDLQCRALSMFLSPSGQDLVFLAENSDRSIRLDDLEMLYYAEVAERAELSGHLEVHGSPARYGTSCRDISVSMNQCDVSALAGLGASAIMQNIDKTNAFLRVWRLHPDNSSVNSLNLGVPTVIKRNRHDWRIVLSQQVLDRVLTCRADRLPNETGGILLGGVDHARRCVHIVVALASPPDSEEWPTMYIRGVKGLKEARGRIVKATAAHLDYLGEWHSHPEGASARPSKDDQNVFAWISDLAAVDGRPAVMLIVAEGEARLFVAQFDPDESEPICLA